MFVGHYAASFAAKSIRAELPLWVLFLAVQFIDYVWALFLLLGIEKARYVEDFTAASPLDLYYMPYTHSLVGAVFWSILFAAIYILIRRSQPKVYLLGLVLGLTVFSHWLTDWLVHVEDLPLYIGGPKIGLGLWQDYWLSQALEFGLLGGCFTWYMAISKPTSQLGRILPWTLILIFFALQLYSHNAPPPPNMTFFAIQALVAYSLFTVVAFYVDGHRQRK